MPVSLKSRHTISVLNGASSPGYATVTLTSNCVTSRWDKLTVHYLEQGHRHASDVGGHVAMQKTTRRLTTSANGVLVTEQTDCSSVCSLSYVTHSHGTHFSTCNFIYAHNKSPAFQDTYHWPRATLCATLTLSPTVEISCGTMSRTTSSMPLLRTARLALHTFQEK